MVALPQKQMQTRDAIYQAYESAQDNGWRNHLGASIIGRECERELWYTFRWTTIKRHEGRILRLFETGNREEERFVADLRRIGVTVLDVDPETGRQWECRDDTGHFGGSTDGVCIGLPEAPKTWHDCEFKTHNEKSFKALVEKGVKIAKPEHWAQMTVYMHLLGLERALYLAKNKNTDELYSERVYYDAAFAMRLLEKARRVIKAPEPPAGISTDSNFFKCKFCDHAAVCHKRTMPARNCRTCLHSSAVDGGAWSCAAGHDMGAGKAALPCHRFIPALVPGKQVDVRGDVIVYQTDAGEWVDDGRV